MRFHHPAFQALHFDYGTMAWSVNHMPLFGAILCMVDHRKMGTMHDVTFHAFLKVLSGGKINRDQSEVIFRLIDLSHMGELNYSELAFFLAIVCAQKDKLEREFLYMNAWKIWVTFNEEGDERVSTREFRRAGLFFDFDYPTMYLVFRDYNWDDEKLMEFQRFRFCLMSCIHARQVQRAAVKYIRYRKFKKTVLRLLQGVLTRVLRDGLFPSPVAVIRAIKLVRIPPMEGTERTVRLSALLNFSYVRNYVAYRWTIMKLFWIASMEDSPQFKAFSKCCCCGFCCFSPDECCGEAEEGEMCPFCCGCYRKKGSSMDPHRKKVKYVRNLWGWQKEKGAKDGNKKPCFQNCKSKSSKKVEESKVVGPVPSLLTLELEEDPGMLEDDDEDDYFKNPMDEWLPARKARCGIL